MKTLLNILSVYLVLAASSFAVEWDFATVSATVKQGGGALATTVFNNRKYLDFVSQANSTQKSDLFIGFRVDNGQLAVVRISDKTVLFTIVTSPGNGGTAANSANTSVFTSGGATIASTSTNFSGAIYDHIKRAQGGSIQSISRVFSGGDGGSQVIKGTAVTTGRKINL
ncbi:MAG: hypothetical protein QOD99_1703 [Chthoniobacter sp.]|jgi:hypothetical protein|nr:hypothetical protein [Chthoniobacter sp.]